MAPDVQPAARPKPEAMILPTLVFSMVEVHRLTRELESLEDYLQQAALRPKADKTSILLPRVSRLLDALATENHCNLLKTVERNRLLQFLQYVAASAPSVHISFATDPSAAFTAKLVGWLRTSIHPMVLLQIGLQPSIAAGCVVRTTNRVFDLSLRQNFDQQKALLVQSLQGAGHER